jgi:hypothetical protein
MALFRPSASGLFWSPTSSWVTSSEGLTTWGPATSLPGPNDDVYLNNFSMTLDIDIPSSINVRLLTNRNKTSNPTVTVGGVISCSINSQIINLTSSILEIGATTTPLIALNEQGITLNISGAVSQSGVNGSGLVATVSNGKFGNVVNLIGDVIGHSNSNTSNIFNFSSNAPTYQQCNVVNITGNISCSAGALITSNAINQEYNINGNIIGRILVGAIEYQYLSINGNTSPPNIGANTASIAISLGSAANCRTIIRGNITCPPSNSFYSSTAVSSLIEVYGNVTNNGTWNAIAAPAVRITGSSLLTIATTSSTGLTSSIFQSGSNFIYPSQNDVRFGQPYGNTSQYSGLMVVPSVNDVRKGTLVNTSSATGSVYIPGVDDVRIGLTTNTGSIGTIIIPVASAVSQSVVYDNGTVGTYTGLDDFWSFGTSSFDATGSGKIFQNNLDVKVGSVSSSMMSALNDTSTTNPTVKRLQNLARVQDMGDQVASSSYV